MDRMEGLPHVEREFVSISSLELGRGQFSTVFKGLLKKAGGDTIPIAVKVLKEDGRDSNKLLDEAILINKLNHPNIIKLVGVCRDSEPLLLLFELMEGGSLLKCLQDSRPTQTRPTSKLSLKGLVKMSIDVVSGCKYLECREDIHSDIAARNCLVSASGVVKLADFGLSHDVRDTGYYRFGGGCRLPFRWMAPETTLDASFTMKSDVWSFGVLLWEMVTLGDVPYNGLNMSGVCMMIQVGQRLDIPGYCPRKLLEIIRSCWRQEASARPAFSALHERLFELACDASIVNDAPFPPFIETISYVEPTLSVSRSNTFASHTGNGSHKFFRNSDGSSSTDRSVSAAKNGYGSIMYLASPDWQPNQHPGSIPGCLPLSQEEILKALREKLACEYELYATINIFANLDPIPIDELFVQLEFKTSKGLMVDKYQAALEPFLLVDSARKLFVIWGQPGQGKTALVKKICHDWAQTVVGNITQENEYIADIQLLLCFSLRNLEGKVERISDIFHNQHPELSHLKNWLKANSKRVLVLLDGFDEFQPPTLCEELYSIFFDPTPNYAPPFPIIVTSRPFAIQEARLVSPAEVCGIPDEELVKFIAKYSSNPENSTKILKYIDEVSLLEKTLFRSPLLLAMLCKLAESNAYALDEQKPFPKTQTTLYFDFCMWLLAEERRKSKKFQDDTPTNAIFEALSRLAFEKTVCDDSRLVFSEEDFKDFQVDVKKAVRIGFLTTDGAASRDRRSIARHVTFLHRTFQEFFAAYYVAQNPEHFAEAFNRMRFKAFLSNQFLIFTAGLLSETCAASETLSKCLEAKMEFALGETYRKTTSELKERQKRFPVADRISDLTTFHFVDIFWSLFAEVRRQAQPHLADSILTPIVAALMERARTSPVWFLSTMTQSGLCSTSILPRGFDTLFGLLDVNGHSFTVAVLSKPLSAVVISQRAGSDEQLVRLGVAELPKETDVFFFNGDAKSLALLLQSGLNLRVTHMCRLNLKSINKSNKSGQSLEASRDYLTVASGGRLDLIYDELPDDDTWARIRERIIARDLQWLTLVCRFKQSANGTASRSGEETVMSLWTSESVQIFSLNFSDLKQRPAALNDVFESVEAKNFCFYGCKLSKRDFEPTRWRRLENWKTLIFNNSVSSADAPIFEESVVIASECSSLELLQFNGCDLPANEKDGDALIESFCAAFERGGGHLQTLGFEQCANLSVKHHLRLKALVEHLPMLKLVKVDDLILHEKNNS